MKYNFIICVFLFLFCLYCNLKNNSFGVLIIICKFYYISLICISRYLYIFVNDMFWFWEGFVIVLLVDYLINGFL